MMLFVCGRRGGGDFKTQEGRLISNLLEMVPLAGRDLPWARSRMTSYFSPLVCLPRSCDSLAFFFFFFSFYFIHLLIFNFIYF